MGKLYINYPMMEFFKDCDSFEDNDYLTQDSGFEHLRLFFLWTTTATKMASMTIQWKTDEYNETILYKKGVVFFFAPKQMGRNKQRKKGTCSINHV